MSQENVDAAKAQYERWNSEDTEAWIAGFQRLDQPASEPPRGISRRN
jgi:hypothetical protein